MQKKSGFSPSQILIIGFLSVIAVGAALLLLPVATTQGISPVDALFTSTSAVCVTGLIVKDTPKDFTLFGQLVILLLIQIGGLGYMTSATIISLVIGKKIGLGERLIMKEALNVLSLEGIVKFTRAVLATTLIFEIIGGLILTLRFLGDMPPAAAALNGFFHAVSAFNNAGFSLFSDNLIRYRGDVTVNAVVASLIILGGIGFITMSDLYSYSRRRVTRLSVHTRLVLATTAILVMAGAVLIFSFEYTNPKTFQSMPMSERVLASLFSSVTARTAGFNTVDYALFRPETLFITIVLMFIGASPGSTGGGVKTTTFAIVILSLCAMIKSSRDTVIFHRRIPADTVSRSLLLIALSIIFIAVASLTVIVMEKIFYLPTIFEVTSAFGTVGLSVGDGGPRSLTAVFSSTGKLLVSLVMFAGRLGPLTLAVAVIRKKEDHFRYPEGRFIIG